MLYRLSTLRQFRVQGRDGDIGRLHDLYVDDLSTLIRYLVIDTEGWLSGRRLLIVPSAFGQAEAGGRVLPTALRRGEIEASPGIATDLPLSREDEIVLHQHHGWKPYWTMVPPTVGGAVPFWGWMARPEPGEPAPAGPDDPEVPSVVRPTDEPSLKSADAMSGSDVIALDGRIGTVADVVVEEAGWTIAYLVIDTRGWLSGRQIVLAPDWLKRVVWGTRTIEIALAREQIGSSPPYDPAAPLDSDYLQALFTHYGYPFGGRISRW